MKKAMTDDESNRYLAWLELQNWIWLEQEGVLAFFTDEGAHEFVETEPGQWVEIENHTDELLEITNPQVIALLSAKKKELRTN